jgi:hypothetical membrane protein
MAMIAMRANWTYHTIREISENLKKVSGAAMNNRYMFLSGLAASVIYILTVVLGAAVRPEYSHIGNAISELFVSGAPNKAAIDSGFILYNSFLVLFSVSVIRLGVGAGSKLFISAGIILLVSALCGLLMNLLFPMDVRDTNVTAPGMMHLVLAGIVSISTMAVMWLFGAVFSKTDKVYGIYTFISLVVVFVSGGLAAFAASKASPYMGLVERVTIGCFIVWIGVTSIYLYRKVQ